jgi:hypothetical protein
VAAWANPAPEKEVMAIATRRKPLILNKTNHLVCFLLAGSHMEPPESN